MRPLPRQLELQITRPTHGDSPGLVHLCIAPSVLEQLSVRAPLGYPSTLENDYLVAIGDRGHFVSYQNNRSLLTQNAERIEHPLLVMWAEGAFRLIEYRDRSVTHQRPSDRETLTLATGEVPSPR